MDTYDEDVGDRDAKRADIAAQLEREAAQLATRVEHFDVVDAGNTISLSDNDHDSNSNL